MVDSCLGPSILTSSFIHGCKELPRISRSLIAFTGNDFHKRPAAIPQFSKSRHRIGFFSYSKEFGKWSQETSNMLAGLASSFERNVSALKSKFFRSSLCLVFLVQLFLKERTSNQQLRCWGASPWKVRWEPHEYAPLPAQPWRSSFLYQAVTVVTGPKDNESHRHLGHSHELKGLQCWCTCNTLLSDCTEKKGGTQNIQNLVS